MAHQLFSLQPIPISDIKPGRIYDKLGDGELAVCPMKIYKDLLVGKIVVVALDYQVHVYEPDEIVYVIFRKIKNKNVK